MKNYYFLVFIAIFLIIISMIQEKKRKCAAIINHRKNHKNKEMFSMKELAQKFVGKECLVYTVASDSSLAKGVIKEITDSGLLIDDNGNLQAINLEYITRIQEWPRNAKGKKKTFFA